MAFYSEGFLFSIVLVFDQCQWQSFPIVVLKIQRTFTQKLKIMALFRHYNESYSELHHSIVIRLKQKYLLHIMTMRDFFTRP